jgi:SAM-dependent methyltransferase
MKTGKLTLYWGLLLLSLSFGAASDPLTIGAKLPEITLPDQHENRHTVMDAKVVLFAPDKDAGELAHQVLGQTFSTPMTTGFEQERKRTRRFFNWVSVVYPLVEHHLWSEYQEVLEQLALPADHRVLDLATGTGMLAGAFARRGHDVVGLDFADSLLARARLKFPQVAFQNFDLMHLEQIGSNSHDVVCMGYLLHGLSPDFRRQVLREAARIAGQHVLVFDYCCRGNWFVRLIEWIEGPNYPGYLAEDRQQEFGQAGLAVQQYRQTSDVGGYWLCSTKRKEGV